MESEFPSNSKLPREPGQKDRPEKKIEKVVTGEVQTRKKPLSKRFMENFFTGTDTKGVFEYVVMDILIPSAKDTIADMVSQGVERKLFGEVRSSSRRGSGIGGFRPGGAGFTAYNRMGPGGSRLREPEPRATGTGRRARGHHFDEIILATRAEANEVLDTLYNVISQYEVASVADLFEMVDMPSNFTDNKWGWTDLRGAEVTRVRNGYLLDLPRPEPID